MAVHQERQVICACITGMAIGGMADCCLPTVIARRPLGVVQILVAVAIDAHADSKPQAPDGMQDTGFEPLLCFIWEPQRMFMRDLLGNCPFLLLLVAPLTPVSDEILMPWLDLLVFSPRLIDEEPAHVVTDSRFMHRAPRPRHIECLSTLRQIVDAQSSVAGAPNEAFA
jgi:hypothetical protein